MEDIEGNLDGKKIRLNEFQADMAGYTSQFLTAAIDQDALDEPLTMEDAEYLKSYLINWGLLDSSDLKYRASDHRGYSTVPDANSMGIVDDPYPLEDLLPFAAAALQASGGYLAATSVADWQATLVKPKDGMDQLYEGGFKDALGERIKLNCEVTEIRQDDNGVRIVYLNKETGETEEITGDYCMCNIPLSVLIKIPSDLSTEFQEATRSVPYAMSLRMGIAYKRRFWEEDDWIYGGQSFSNISELGTIGYPDNDYNAEKGVMLGMYNFGTSAAHVSSLPYEERVQLALDYNSRIHPQVKDEFMSGFSVAWHLEPYSLGAWPSYNSRTREAYMPKLQEPDGRVYLVGEHLSNVNAWIEGAVQAAWMQVEKLHTRVMQG